MSSIELLRIAIHRYISSKRAERTIVSRFVAPTFAAPRLSVFLLVTGTLALSFLNVNFLFAEVLPAKTPIDTYVHQEDKSYEWKVVSSKTEDGVKTIVVDMVSQNWRSSDEVDRTQWRHWVTIAAPEKVRSSIGFLMIGGGKNGGSQPKAPDKMVTAIAKATGTVVAELKMVPNQSLVFHNDGERRSEDNLIGYTWDQYLKTGDANWLARNPMVKSAVRAMDTVTAVMASDAGGKQTVNRFVVAGGSKRGWTTWLTGAMDKRVVGIIPIVIDVLNINASMRHHFAAYGYWAPSVGDYVHHKIMERMNDPRLESAYTLIDPYQYRHRLTMPKLILNAAGDQFFLPDSSKFYWNDLQGEKHLRYVPNADHGMGGSDAQETVIAFYSMILAGRERPQFTWTEEDDGALRVKPKDKPRSVKLWQAHNPHARDFRVETLGRKYSSTNLTPNASGEYIGNVDKPETGFKAYFVELLYDVDAEVPLKLTTNVRVVPDILPYKDKDPTQPATVTVVCEAASEEAAKQVMGEASAFVKERNLAEGELLTKHVGAKCYLNFRPSEKFERAGLAVTVWLKSKGCKSFAYQLESGAGITE